MGPAVSATVLGVEKNALAISQGVGSATYKHKYRSLDRLTQIGLVVGAQIPNVVTTPCGMHDLDFTICG
jgi:hypothetical protein